MNLKDLETLIVSASWFEHVGEFPGAPNVLRIRRIEPADGLRVTIEIDNPDGQPVEWDWLPTTLLQEDPIHGSGLKTRAREMGKEAEMKDLVNSVYAITLKSLRRMKKTDRLMVGAHDSHEPARGGALYAARMATSELVVDAAGFWCSVIPLYSSGYWPRGVTRDQRLLVY